MSAEKTLLEKTLERHGYVVTRECRQPIQERVGELHLHVIPGCTTAYCTACAKPAVSLEESAFFEDEDGHAYLGLNQLCLICPHCGLIFDCSGKQDAGLLHPLVSEGGNLIETIENVFGGAPAEEHARKALRFDLEQRIGLLQMMLRTAEQQRQELDGSKPEGDN
jgi:hypothetical protein